jgi:FKBP-type peptidyl-prolyl cis-trans isomerase 2
MRDIHPASDPAPPRRIRRRRRLCDHRRMRSKPPASSASPGAVRRPEPPDRRTGEPVEFFYGGDDLLAKVEEALAGHEAGDELHLHLEPEHAFGDYRPELVCFEDRALFPEQLEPGMAFEGLPEGGPRPTCRPT